MPKDQRGCRRSRPATPQASPPARAPRVSPPRSRERGSSPARALVGLSIVVLLLAAVGGAVTGGLGAGASPVAVASASGGPGTPSPASSASASGAIAPSPSGSPPSSPTPSSPASSAAPSGSPEPGASFDPVLADRLDARLDELRRKHSIPGVSVAILWDDGRQWLGVSGRADVAARVPVTPASAFALASISKTFTAAVVLQLVEEGSLSLDGSVAARLPDYRLDPRITVRMLLDHTSGLPDFFFNRRIDAALQGAPGATWTPQKTWSFVPKKRSVPGTTWAYSNTNYLLLGELVEAVTGRSLAAEVRDRLLAPLGLEDTWYQGAEEPRTTATVGYRLQAKRGGGVRAVRVAPDSPVMPFRSVISAAGGAGSLAGTALDTARWMQAFAGGRVLTPAMQLAMIDDASLTAAMEAKIPYGLGIQVVTLNGRLALGHSGRYLGYRSVVRYLPEVGVTIAVLTNQGAADPARIASALLKLVLPKPEPVASPSPSPVASPSPSP